MFKSQQPSKPSHPGLRLKSPARYDRLVWLWTLGRSRRFRELMLRPAGLQPGEDVLDVSCGTGSLALLAREQVGSAGRVRGIDASEEMIGYARKKARRAGLDVEFEVAPAQKLPFEDASFDVVLNTLALHHLPRASRYEALGEIRRVLKPGGRALIEDFATSRKRTHGFGILKHRHGSVPPEEIATAMRAAGFEIADTGAVGTKNLHFVLGRAPGGIKAEIERPPLATAIPKSRHPVVPLGAAAFVLLILAHTAIAASIGRAAMHHLTNFDWRSIGAIAAAAFIIMIASHLFLAKMVWRRR